jgi:hypothetical protein
VPVLNLAAQHFPGDDGSADPGCAAALAAYARGGGGEHAALLALAGSRLLVPVVATPAGGGTEMALPTLIGTDGRPALPAFTCLDALTRWRPAARPVPVPAALVWQAGAHEAGAVVVDVAGPVPLAVDGARLAALAQGRLPPPPHADPDVLALVRGVLAAEPAVTHFTAGPPAHGADLALQLTLGPGCSPARAQGLAARCAEMIVSGGAGSVRRGVEISLTALGPGTAS